MVSVDGVGDLLITHRALLPAGAAGADHRLRHARARRDHPPRRLRATSRGLRRRAPQRVLHVDWGQAAGRTLPGRDRRRTRIDRRGLLRDISTVLADEHISIERLTCTG